MYSLHRYPMPTENARRQVLQDILEESNHATFQALLQFAAAAHHAPDMSSSFVHRSRIIPTALTFAGGVNSADHAQTFPTLVNLLKQQVGYVQLCFLICWLIPHNGDYGQRNSQAVSTNIAMCY